MIELVPGDILLYDRNNPFSKFIKFRRGEKYSHAALASREGLMLESTGFKVCDERPLDLSDLTAVFRCVEPIPFEVG